MSEDQSLSLVYTVGLIVLVGSALAARAIPVGQMVRMALGWVGIFAFVILVFSFRSEMSMVGNRVAAELGLSKLFGEEQRISGSTLRIRKNSDGHFWVNANIAGSEVRFLIDSGATTTAMSVNAANDVGAEISTNGFPSIVSTANGDVTVQRGVIEAMRVGPLEVRDHRIVVADVFGETNVLGMNFLSELKSWRVEGDEMILEPFSENSDN